jgi:flagellar hook-length control protein FliK
VTIKLITGAELSALNREQPTQATRLVVDMQYVGKVMGVDSENITSVEIGDQIFRMQLPELHEPGQTINLRYLGADPKPTFMLLQPSPPTLLPSNVLLSQAGKLVLEALSATAQFSSLNQVDGSNMGPLLTSVASPQMSAIELQNALRFSGLFYESHIASFIQGKRTIEQLRKEMQNQKDINSASIISKQLDVLEKQQIQWAGMIWPKQHMQWTIGRDSSGSSPELPEKKSFKSTLALDLPALGKIIFHIVMNQDRINIQIEVASQQSRRAIEVAIPQLRNHFESYTNKLEGISVLKNG